MVDARDSEEYLVLFQVGIQYGAVYHESSFKNIHKWEIERGRRPLVSSVARCTPVLDADVMV